jgi:predicted dehydrogenase
MKPLRGAIVGYGFIASKGHVPALLERAKLRGDVEIVAVADVSAERRALAKQLLPAARIYDDHEQLIAREREHLDFVDIAAPPSTHAIVAHAAFDAGLHVLCEKPLATSAAQARAMLDHARQARRVIFPCHNYKHAPVVQAVRELISQDRIGRVKLVTLNTFRDTHAKGVREWNTDWRRERAYSGGGVAMDHGSHTFYLAFEWLASYPTAVTAQTATFGAFDTEDNFSCTVTFPTGLATAQLTWTAGVRKVVYAIQGEKGAITVADDELELVTRDAGGFAVERMSIASHWGDASHVSWFSSLFDQFNDAITGGEYVGTEAREALLCVHLIERAYESAKRSCLLLPLDPLYDNQGGRTDPQKDDSSHSARA